MKSNKSQTLNDVRELLAAWTEFVTFLVAVLEPLQSDVHGDFDLLIDPDVSESSGLHRSRVFRWVRV